MKKVLIEFEVESEKSNDYLEQRFESVLKRGFDNGTTFRKMSVKIYNK